MRDVSKTIATSKMKVFVVLLVCGLQLCYKGIIGWGLPTNVTKNSISGVVAVLDLPLEL